MGKLCFRYPSVLSEEGFFPPAISAEPDGKKIGKNNLLALQKQVVAVGIQMYFAYLKHTKPF